MPRILITGAWFSNKGAEAMIRSVQAGILSRLPSAEPLLRRVANETADCETLRGLRLISMGSKRRARLGLLCRAGSIGKYRLAPLYAALRRELDLAAVIDISGYKFGDAWQGPVNWSRTRLVASTRQSLANALSVDEWSLYHALSIPVFYLPQAWGPFENRESRRLAERLLRGAARVYARDSVSYDHLRGLSAFSEQKVALASDIAFSFKGAEPQVGRDLLTGLGVRVGERPLVGIVPNMRVYEKAEGEGARNSYVQRLIAIARWFIAERQCQVVLMPHELKPASAIVPDDRYLCRLVAEAVEDKENVRAAVQDYSAEELKAMIGETEMLVSSRFHSIIAAMSLRRPVVSLAWSHKYHELMKSVGLEAFVAPHETDTQSLLTLCENAWEDRVALTGLLREHVPAHEASAAQVLREVTQMIGAIIGS